MDLELNERLRSLRDYLEDFINEMEDNVPTDHDLEFEFMEDESGLSNTDMDTLLDSFEGSVTLIQQMIRVGK
jgi:hypothetical protein